MIFFPRDLQEGIQDSSGWTRKATRKFNRNLRLYKKYFSLIRPHLPASAIAFSKYSFHDSEVANVQWEAGKLFLILDTEHEEMPFPERYVHLIFASVIKRPKILPKKREWWNLEELHLGTRINFCLHVLFTNSEMEIAADEVRIKILDSLD